MHRPSRIRFACLLSIALLSCKDDSSVVQSSNLGDYLFVERIILTDATLLRGDPSMINPLAVDPSMYYTFDSRARTLSYRSGESSKLLVTAELKLIFGDEHFWLPPLAGAGGGLIYLTPMYYASEWMDPTLRVNAIGADDKVEIYTSHSPTGIYLAVDSSWTRTITRIDSVLQINGPWAILEYHDSITITNHGRQPKENVTWSPLSITSGP